MVVGIIMSSQQHWFAKIYLTDKQIEEIIGVPLNNPETPTTSLPLENFNASSQDKDKIEIHEIKGKKFPGKVMIIHDPKRVKIAVSSKLGESGETVLEMAKREGAIAAINGGGFFDPNGQGNGAIAEGITIKNGTVLSMNDNETKERIIGINKNGQLIVGRYNVKECLEMEIAEAVSFGPPLIINGQPMITQGDGGWGWAPRTGIGQRKDGAIIFVIIDGRQIGSLGASLRELQDVFLEYEAVTAANLDGGASTTMVYDNNVINTPSSVFGIRYLPTAFIVTPVKGK